MKTHLFFQCSIYKYGQKYKPLWHIKLIVEINYEKLFSRNIDEQVEIVDELSKGLIIRDAILEKQRCH